MIFIVWMLILTTTINAYPVIISEQGTNHTLNKEIVYSYPERYYRGVDSVTFTNQPLNISGHLKTGGYEVKWWWRWSYYYFYDAKIRVYGVQIINYTYVDMKDGLNHELCHHQEFYKLHKKVANETYAETCILR